MAKVEAPLDNISAEDIQEDIVTPWDVEGK